METATEIVGQVSPENRFGRKKEAGRMAFFWLSAFFVVYCARPEDWIPGLKYIPLAKLTVGPSLWCMFTSLGQSKRKLKDLPVESRYLLGIVILLLVGALFSPIWKGGAISHSLDFAKVYVAWVLTFLLVSDLDRLQKIIFIQASSVAVVSGISIIKGHNLPRLSGALGGMYSNPNDLAFCIVLSLPFCLAFMLSSKRAFSKVLWIVGMLIMLTALFLTASRSGFIDLAVTGMMCLWHFGVKGRRFFLIIGVGIVGLILMFVAGGKMKERLASLSAGVAKEDVDGSYEARLYLMQRAFDAIEQYPIFGIGVNNFMTFSGDWHEVHMSYLQIASEGGIPVFILYFLFFKRGFGNLRRLRKRKDLDRDESLVVGALHSSLLGFAVGALFAPVAYQFFSYFAVAYTSAMLQIIGDRKDHPPGGSDRASRPLQPVDVYAGYGRVDPATPVRG